MLNWKLALKKRFIFCSLNNLEPLTIAKACQRLPIPSNKLLIDWDKNQCQKDDLRCSYVGSCRSGLQMLLWITFYCMCACTDLFISQARVFFTVTFMFKGSGTEF